MLIKLTILCEFVLATIWVLERLPYLSLHPQYAKSHGLYLRAEQIVPNVILLEYIWVKSIQGQSISVLEKCSVSTKAIKFGYSSQRILFKPLLYGNPP